MPALPPASDDSVLNSYAEGILGKYTAEFAGALSAMQAAIMHSILQSLLANIAHNMQEASPTCLDPASAHICPPAQQYFVDDDFDCSCAADGGSSGNDSELAEALQRVREQLHSTQSSAAVCLICLETMHNDDAVWHCSQGCCCVLHLLCIQAWSRQQVAASAYSTSADNGRSGTHHICPSVIPPLPYLLHRTADHTYHL